MLIADPSPSLTQLWWHRKTWLTIVAGAVILALADAAQTLLIMYALGRQPIWIRMVLRDLTFWLTFVAWMPAVLWLADRFRLTWPLSWTRVAIHIVGGASFAVVQIASAAWLDPLRPRTDGAFIALLARWVMRHSAQDFLAYWAVVGAYHTIHFYQEARRREVAAARLETSLTAARLQALRAQLNPHFLFNTLNTISVLTRKGDQAAVTAMLTRLGTLLRVALDDTCPQEIPLARELEFLDGYLEIQKIRFSNRLHVRRAIAPEVLDALVPSMILQPLIENAVDHGVAACRGAGGIAIEASRERSTLRLRVIDTGPGFRSRRSTPHTGIGLANTAARLAQLYGDSQQIACGDSPDLGGMVTISIPFRTARMDRTVAI